MSSRKCGEDGYICSTISSLKPRRMVCLCIAATDSKNQGCKKVLFLFSFLESNHVQVRDEKTSGVQKASIYPEKLNQHFKEIVKILLGIVNL